MNYEQKYKEALERARTKLTNEVAADIFPELAKSKDERIELLNYLYDVHDDDEERARWIAWLEKQCNKDEEILVLKDQIESLRAANIAIKETHKIELEKQDKQKPADKVEPKFKVGDWITIKQ